ncbi:winged helix-turn-helix domain-containing protein [Acidocella sp.]|uniref:winged helix-turn-helix domain-containing protein n=1 Tax=Acidocella sp. TaxID=50710 RepID=UPI002633F1F2|nr:winged helix-turn-helix domain-containing protein [Acidocella sp.]
MSDQAFGSDPYAAVLADLMRRRDEIDNAIRVIEAVRGDGAGNAVTAAPEQPASESNQNGQFIGMSIAEAAKLLLRNKRKTLSSAEIVEGLIAGGLALTSAEPSNVIGSILTRRFYGPGDIVRVSRGQWGLKEWYPGRNFQKREESSKVKTESSSAADLADMPANPEDGEGAGS